MPEKKIIITIDGWSSCGKSTLARQLAAKLKYTYIDSGAMYRAITLYFLNNVFGFEPFALRFVGGDLSALVDHFMTPGTGRLLAHLLGLGFAIALAGFFYRRKIFLRV